MLAHVDGRGGCKGAAGERKADQANSIRAVKSAE
jgi:hypothetical protein